MKRKIYLLILLCFSISTASAEKTGARCFRTDASNRRLSVCTPDAHHCKKYMDFYYHQSPSTISVPGGCSGDWYVFKNASNRDQDGALRSLVGEFKEATANGTFNELCSSVGLICSYVIDWEGRYKGCAENTNDGSRVAYCAKDRNT